MDTEALRQALDDSVLMHTGRSIGELASQRVIDDMWPLIETRQGELYGRSTPLEFDDLTHVLDRRGQLWCYSEPSDTWTMRDRPSRASLTVPTSARSYQRLMAEFGPLTRYTDKVSYD